MTPETAAVAYLEDCKARNLSENTIKQYRHGCVTLSRRLPEKDFASILSTDIDAAWATALEDPATGSNTKRQNKVVWNVWLDWCMENAGLVAHNLRKARCPKKRVPRRPKVTVSHFTALLAACAQLKTEYDRVRARALLHVTWSVMARKAELLDLRIEDTQLDADPPLLRILCGKGGWSGFLPLSDRAADALRAWLKIRGNCDQPWLWVNSGLQRMRMGREAWADLLKRLAQIAGIDERLCLPHAIRRGSATSCLQAGTDIATVSAYLRHSNIATTILYVGASEQRIGAVRNWMAEAPVPAAAAPPIPSATPAAPDLPPARPTVAHTQQRRGMISRSTLRRVSLAGGSMGGRRVLSRGAAS